MREPCLEEGADSLGDLIWSLTVGDVICNDEENDEFRVDLVRLGIPVSVLGHHVGKSSLLVRFVGS